MNYKNYSISHVRSNERQNKTKIVENWEKIFENEVKNENKDICVRGDQIENKEVDQDDMDNNFKVTDRNSDVRKENVEEVIDGV